MDQVSYLFARGPRNDAEEAILDDHIEMASKQIRDAWTDEETDYGDFDVTIQQATSTDASTWSSYSTAGGEVTAQYVRFRAVLSNSNANITPLVSELTATAEY